MWFRNKKTGGLFNTDYIKNDYIRKLNDISKKEYENKIDKTQYNEEIRKATEEYKKRKGVLKRDEIIKDEITSNIDERAKQAVKNKVDINKFTNENAKAGVNTKISEEAYKKQLAKVSKEPKGIKPLNQWEDEKILSQKELSNMTWGEVIEKNTEFYNKSSVYDFDGVKQGKYKYEEGWRDNRASGVIKQSDLDKLISKEDWENAQNNISQMSEYSSTNGTGMSDKQHSTLSKMSMSEMQSLARDYNIDTKGLSKKQLMAKIIAIFND